MIKELYDRFKAEIEAQKGIKVGYLTLTDEGGAVSIKITPRLNEIALNFTQAGNELPPSDVVTTPTPTEDGVIIEWGNEGGGEDGLILALSTVSHNVYRKTEAETTFSLVAQGVTASSYEDKPLAAGTYVYYVVAVDETGKEGIPSEQSTITI